MLDLADRWAKLRATQLGQQFPRTIELTESDGLLPNAVELPTPLTLIFGLNGAGKSRLLGRISELQAGCVVVNLSELIYYLLRDVGARDDIQELIDETGPLADDKVRRSEVCGLVRRDYQEINWYAVPIADSPFRDIVGEDIVPIFTVRYAEQDYDFKSMGLGELSAHMLLWILAYSRGTSDAPLLLDEPEAFMPAPSREVILAYLLEEAIRRPQPIVVASHSLEMIQPALDCDSAVYLEESGNTITVVGPSPELAELVAGLFGRSASTQYVVLCEDEAAVILADELIRVAAPRFWQGVLFFGAKATATFRRYGSDSRGHPAHQLAVSASPFLPTVIRLVLSQRLSRGGVVVRGMMSSGGRCLVCLGIRIS